MNFASDNWAGATPAVMAAVARHNDGYAAAYGADPLTAAVAGRFSEIFETDVEVWFTATGTGSNSLALAGMARPGGLVFCSEEAHIHVDEWGATEFQSGGMKLVPMAQQHGRVSPKIFAATLDRFPDGGRFGTPVALSLTQASECGTVYPLDQLRALTGMARQRGLTVHMDGARFGNAVAALGASPAEITWRSGVDVLSFGATKNGCFAAEAIVVFAPEKFRDLAARRQRAGHTLSKARFIAAQFEGYFEDGNWLKTAAHANGMAARLQQGILASQTARLGWPTEANEVFAVLPKAVIARVRAAGGTLYEWPAESLPEGERPGTEEELVRLVTSWATRADEVERFLGML